MESLHNILLRIKMVIMKRQELGTGFRESMYTITRKVNQFHLLIIELDH